MIAALRCAVHRSIFGSSAGAGLELGICHPPCDLIRFIGCPAPDGVNLTSSYRCPQHSNERGTASRPPMLVKMHMYLR